MIRFSEYRKNCLDRSFGKLDVIESVNRHFDLLQIDLLESVNLPRNLNEGYLGEAAWILDMIAEEDKELNHAVIREHIALCKQEFHRYMCESVDFDAFLSQGGPQGMEGLQETDKLLKRVRWALDGFKDQVKQIVTQIIGNRNAGTSGSPATPSTTPASSNATSSPTAINTSAPTQAPPTANPNNAPTQVAQYGNSQQQPAGSAAPWWFRKTKSGPGWWKGSTNLAKSAVKGVWDKIKGGWRGDNLSDATRANIVNLVENLFEQTEADLLSTIDQWTEKLYGFLKQNIDSYAKVAPAAAASPTTATTQTTPGMAPTPSMESPASPMAPARKPRSAPTHNLSDADFEAKIRAGEPVFSSVLSNKSAGAGISLARNLERYNAFREKFGLSKLDKLPKWETEALSKGEIEGYKGLSQDRMRSWAENPAGKRRLRQLATSYGLETPKSRNVEFWKDFATQIHQKLQSGEQPKIVAPDAPPEPVAPVASPVTEPTQNTAPTASTPPEPQKVEFPKNDPAAIAPRTVEPPKSRAHVLAQRMGINLGGDTTPAASTSTKPARSIFDTSPEEVPEAPTPAADTTPTSANVTPEEPTATPEVAPTDSQADPAVRAEKLKANFMHDIKAFTTGVDRDGSNISLKDAEKFALSDEDLSAIVDQLAAKKGGLDKVSDEDLLYAANDQFVNKYIQGTGENPDAVRNKVAAIIDGTPGLEAGDSGGEDLDAMLGQFDDEHDAAEEKKNPIIDDVMSKIPNEVLGHLDDETTGEMRKQASRLIDQNPSADPSSIAQKLMRLAAQMSKADEIYSNLPPHIQSELEPGEMKSMIAEMLTAKKLQNITCPNCGSQPGRIESCPRCRGKGKVMELASLPEDMIKPKLVEALQKKKMESTVDPITKEPEYQEFRDLWPTDQAARSDLFRQVQIEQAKGGSPDDIHNRLKNHMTKLILQDKKKQGDDSADDDVDYWGDEEREQNGPLIQARDALSNERIPGTPDTYFDFLNKKLGDAEQVDQEIRHALKATGNNLPQALNVIKTKFGDMTKVA